jgi:hypothetical protein
MALLKAHGAFDHSNEALEVAPTICAATKDPNSDDDPATLKFLRLVAGLRYSITARKPDFPRFLELPRELRDVIYAHYLDDNMLYRWDFRMLPILKSVGWEPQLFSASHQVRCEAFEVYLRKATSIGIVSLWRAEEFMKILGSFPTSRPFELVRDIRLFNIHVLEWVVQHEIKKKGEVPPSPNSYLQLLLRLPNLRRLELTFHAINVTTPPLQGRRRVPRNLSDFIDAHDFHLLLGCEKLEEMFLDGILPAFFDRGVTYSQDHSVSMKTLRDFGLWVKTLFAREGQEGARDIKVWIQYREESHETYIGGARKGEGTLL